MLKMLMKLIANKTAKSRIRGYQPIVYRGQVPPKPPPPPKSTDQAPETKVTVHIGPGYAAKVEEKLIDKPDGTRVRAIYYEIYAVPTDSSGDAH